MVKMKYPSFKDGNKFKSKSDLKSDFNMGASFLEFVCNDIMTEVAVRGVEARSRPRFRSVESYYSVVKELFNQVESIWTQDETSQVDEMFNEISKRIDYNKRELRTVDKNGKEVQVDPAIMAAKIELIQRAVYNLIRKYNMLIPISVSRDSEGEKLKMLRTAFGLHGKHSEDNQGVTED